jgi:protein-S-isoprenylcysteine O-methyltransferase Ste14
MKSIIKKLIGQATINPVIFYSGKICGYLSWGILLGYIFNIIQCQGFQNTFLQTFSKVIAALGLMIVVISMINLGGSIRLGLPTEKTTLKTSGLYRLSRNPIYLGFNLMSIAAMAYCMNIVVWVLGIYSMLTYHLIIMGEEKFLAERFKDEYANYKKKVRRYI